jgi:hypothetical protein
MTDFASIITGINQVTQTVGAVNGMVNVMAPAMQNMNMAVNNVAGTFGFGNDMYGPPPGYYPPQQGIPTQMPNYTLSTDQSSPIGTIGSALGGAGIGAIMGKKLAGEIKPPKGSDAATEGIASKLSPGSRNMVMSGLKAGGIGAAIGGLFSGVENMMRLSKNEITGGEATGNIVADTSVGFFTGVSGLAAGTAGAMLLGGAASMGGMIGAGVFGLVGAVGMDLLLRKTGIRQSIANGIRSMVG